MKYINVREYLENYFDIKDDREEIDEEILNDYLKAHNMTRQQFENWKIVIEDYLKKRK